MQILLYLLLFLFGYMTHRAFHAYTSAKTGSLIFLHSKLTAILILLRSLEQYSYVKSFGMLQLVEKGASEKEVEAYKIIIDNDIDFYKQQSIKVINKQIPEYLKVLEHFENWEQAMLYVAKFKQEIPTELFNDKEN